MHRVQLDRDGAQVELAGRFGGRLGVHGRVHVGHQAEPPGVVGDQRQQVLDRLDPGRLRAVLGEQQGDVDTLGLEQGVEPGRDRITVGAEHVTPRGILTEIDRPLHPRQRHRTQPGHVHMGVHYHHAVDHGGGYRSSRRSPARWARPDSI